MSNEKGSNSNKDETGSQVSSEVNESNLVDDTIKQKIDSFKQKLGGELIQKLFSEFEQKSNEILAETENQLTELKQQYEDEIQQSKRDLENFKKAHHLNQPEADTS